MIKDSSLLGEIIFHAAKAAENPTLFSEREAWKIVAMLLLYANIQLEEKSAQSPEE